jgi:steroid delta-isomerase-like uncharacterized protein
VTAATSIVDRVVAAIEARDADAFAALYAEDAILREPVFAEPSRGRDAIRQGEQALMEAFSDISVEVGTVVADGRTVAVEAVLGASHTGPLDLGEGETLDATGRRIELPMAWFFEVGEDGLIRAERDYFDTGSLMAQLSPPSPPAP